MVPIKVDKCYAAESSIDSLRDQRQRAGWQQQRPGAAFQDEMLPCAWFLTFVAQFLLLQSWIVAAAAAAAIMSHGRLLLLAGGASQREADGTRASHRAGWTRAGTVLKTQDTVITRSYGNVSVTGCYVKTKIADEDFNHWWLRSRRSTPMNSIFNRDIIQTNKLVCVFGSKSRH